MYCCCLVMISIHFTYHLVAAFITSCCHAYTCSFITPDHKGNQTTTPTSLTVTLYQLSYTESFLLPLDYSKIFSSIGPNVNMNSLTALRVHEKQNTFPIFHTGFKCGAVFWCNQHPIPAQSKEMLNTTTGQEWHIFSRTFFTSYTTVRSPDLCEQW